MTVIIGIDPHKATHAACAIDDNEMNLAHVQVRAGKRQVPQLLKWAADYDKRVWAIESAGGLGYLLGQQLVAAGEDVVDVPATLSSRVRLLGSGRSNKNDRNDATDWSQKIDDGVRQSGTGRTTPNLKPQVGGLARHCR